MAVARAAANTFLNYRSPVHPSPGDSDSQTRVCHWTLVLFTYWPERGTIVAHQSHDEIEVS